MQSSYYGRNVSPAADSYDWEGRREGGSEEVCKGGRGGEGERE